MSSPMSNANMDQANKARDALRQALNDYTSPGNVSAGVVISGGVADDLLTALSAQSAKLAKAREAERAWAKLAERPSWEISFNGLVEEDGWTVHSVTGGVNDREWNELACAATPLEALLQALGADQ